jgi:hypothetical protein
MTRSERTQGKTAARLALMVGIAAAGLMTASTTAHAVCYVCLHNCCLRTHIGGFENCSETSGHTTGQCIGCKVDETKPCYMPSGDRCGSVAESTTEPNESSVYNEDAHAECTRIDTRS